MGLKRSKLKNDLKKEVKLNKEEAAALQEISTKTMKWTTIFM